MSDTTTPEAPNPTTKDLGIEIAERAADQHAESATKFRKEFVVPEREWLRADKSAQHEANEHAVRQGLINAGLRVGPEVKISHSQKKHSDGRSLVITYTVDVSVAGTTEDFSTEHSRVDGLDPVEAAPELNGDLDDEAKGDDLDPADPQK